MRYICLFAFIILSCIFINTAVYFHNNRDNTPVCSLDGTRIQPLYEVIFVKQNSSSRHFSCIFNASLWFRENSKQFAYILVTDEATGKKIKANQAFYVVSDIVTTHYTGNRIHVFAEKSAAKLHAQKYNGKFVKTPFKGHAKKSIITVKYKTSSSNDCAFLFSSFRYLFITPCFLTLSIKPYNFKIIQVNLIRLSKGYFNPPCKPG